MKRMLQMTLAAIMLTIAGTAAALAGEVEATIVEIRPDASVMVLSDGQTYSIPVDFFVDDLKPGMIVYQDMIGSNGLCLLGRGQQITETMLQRLRGNPDAADGQFVVRVPKPA